uniref:Uncharacterized protein n=1 Tax=Anguilla anguilla TaxID=7936 RepID=A0A0E9RBF4_ANGAN
MLDGVSGPYLFTKQLQFTETPGYLLAKWYMYTRDYLVITVG